MEDSKRDRLMAFTTLQNLALCYQKKGVLEECALCLESSLAYLPPIDKGYSFPQKMSRLRRECKLKMQLCAILSQIHKHGEALSFAKEAVGLSHVLLRELLALCKFYKRKIMISSSAQGGGLSIDPLEESISMMERTAIKLKPIVEEVLKRIVPSHSRKTDDSAKGEKRSRRKAQKAYDDEIGETPVAPAPGESAFKDSKDMDEEYSPAIRRADSLLRNLSSKTEGNQRSMTSEGTAEDNPSADMRNILGYLNQNEWIQSLNIGNIMQI